MSKESPETTQLKKRRVLESISRGSRVIDACRAANIGRRTFYDWLKNDPQFAVQVAHTEEAASQAVEDALFVSAVSGKIPAIIFWLCNREPDRWRSVTKLEHRTSSDSEKLDEIQEAQRKLLKQYTEQGFDIEKGFDIEQGFEPPSESDLNEELKGNALNDNPEPDI